MKRRPQRTCLKRKEQITLGSSPAPPLVQSRFSRLPSWATGTAVVCFATETHRITVRRALEDPEVAAHPGLAGSARHPRREMIPLQRVRRRRRRRLPRPPRGTRRLLKERLCRLLKERQAYYHPPNVAGLIFLPIRPKRRRQRRPLRPRMFHRHRFSRVGRLRRRRLRCGRRTRSPHQLHRFRHRDNLRSQQRLLRMQHPWCTKPPQVDIPPRRRSLRSGKTRLLRTYRLERHPFRCRHLPK
mmetsp:Transcript_3326/g.11538  ORF Transcript_3326/g.11538 Transcript_3326/m.11538 type:complete len:242 (-) Transcript_3326:517-1242(-)